MRIIQRRKCLFHILIVLLKQIKITITAINLLLLLSEVRYKTVIHVYNFNNDTKLEQSIYQIKTFIAFSFHCHSFYFVTEFHLRFFSNTRENRNYNPI